MIGLLKELTILPEEDKPPEVHCTIFEDNKGCIDMVKSPKMRPRTKHIALKYHHFRSHIGKTVSIKYIETGDQIADIFTKALNDGQFCKLIKFLNGW